MKKKILLALVIVSMLVCLFAISASATLVDDIYYTFSSNNGVNTATVNSKNQKCTLEIVNIPEEVMYKGTKYTVTTITEQAFGCKTAANANKTIKEVTIPKTVSSIGKHCFRSCTSLEKVTMKAAGGAFKFEDAEFYQCTSLTYVDFSEAYGLRSIGQYAFTGCPLETVLLPEGLEDIKSNVFSGQTGIKEIVLPSTLIKISGKQAFSSTAFTSIVLPKGLTALGNNIFQSSALESIVIPAGVTSVGEHCFNGTKSLKYVVIANPDVTNYNNAMFYNSKVELIFFAGTEDSAKTFASRLSTLTFNKFVSYDDYLKNPTAEYKNTIVYGTRNCECGNLANDDVKFQFTNYISPMHDAVVCDCGKTTPVKTYAPIITFAGYSSKIAGDRICLGYTVNSESLAIYQEKTHKTLRLGFVVSGDVSSLSPLNVVENEIKSDNSKVLAIEVSTDYCGLDFILSGFSKVDKYDTEIIMNLFTYDGENINYVSIKTTVNDDKTITEKLVEESSLYTITYNKFAQ